MKPISVSKMPDKTITKRSNALVALNSCLLAQMPFLAQMPNSLNVSILCHQQNYLISPLHENKRRIFSSFTLFFGSKSIHNFMAGFNFTFAHGDVQTLVMQGWFIMVGHNPTTDISSSRRMNVASSWSIFSQLRDIHMRLFRRGQGDICTGTRVVCYTQETDLLSWSSVSTTENQMTMNSLTVGCLGKSLKAVFCYFYGLCQELRFWGQNEKKLFSMYMLQNSCNFSNRNRRNYPVLLSGSSHGTWDDSVRRQLGKGNTSKVKTEQWKGYLRESKYNFCRQINKKSWETFTLKCMFSDSAVKSIRYRTNRLVLSLTLTSSATLGRITKSLDFLLHGGA